jgi:tyrosyl-DNA phosphodiesterase-1
MFHLEWLVAQYPEKTQQLPLTLVHHDERLSSQAPHLPRHIRSFVAPNMQPFGTHHSKMMLLFYSDGMRVVVHTANMIPSDWTIKTQGAWVSPKFPRMDPNVPRVNNADPSALTTGFASDLFAYLAACANHLPSPSSVLPQSPLAPKKERK